MLRQEVCRIGAMARLSREETGEQARVLRRVRDGALALAISGVGWDLGDGLGGSRGEALYEYWNVLCIGSTSEESPNGSAW